jgi:hypothetical protein
MTNPNGTIDNLLRDYQDSVYQSLVYMMQQAQATQENNHSLPPNSFSKSNNRSSNSSVGANTASASIRKNTSNSKSSRALPNKNSIVSSGDSITSAQFMVTPSANNNDAGELYGSYQPAQSLNHLAAHIPGISLQSAVYTHDSVGTEDSYYGINTASNLNHSNPSIPFQTPWSTFSLHQAHQDDAVIHQGDENIIRVRIPYNYNTFIYFKATFLILLDPNLVSPATSFRR